ncbi:peptidylprolyl isomerase [Reinekea sp. G2M2-21]|uniref:peptidylprolyl isomerase n=1 Tax=Reinekea sp. G2M2-21 TaxID=2788942 RepID=UPI0018A94140|nr:peptidylprolyl isomerase [Reinekea sp. G2M2-21]
MARKNLSLWLVLTYFVAVFVSCSRNDSPAEATQEEPWAIVNGSALTEPELQFARNRFFGDQFVDARADQKIRDSLIASRALSQRAEKALSEEILAELDIAVRAYREERLIAAYIEANRTVEPVSAQMVAEYYQQHLAEFGEATIRRVEVLEADIASAGLTQAELSKKVFEYSKISDWSAQVLPDYMKIYEINSMATLSPKLKSVVEGTAIGSRSPLVIEEHRISVIHVVSESKIPAQPLSNVSVEIRKRLAAAQLKKEIKSLTEEALSESDVIKKF